MLGMIKNKRRMLTSWAITLVMALNAFLPFNTAWTRADSAEQGKDVTDILTSLNATVTQNGKEITGNTLPSKDNISIQVSFGVPVEGDWYKSHPTGEAPDPQAIVQSGDRADIALGTGFTLSEVDNLPISLKYNGYEVGKVVSFNPDQSGMVYAHIVFTWDDDSITSNDSDVSCQFSANLKCDETDGSGSEGNTTFTILTKNYTITPPPAEIVYDVKKSGTADLANKRIHWTATVTATQGDQNIDLGGYTFSDDLTSVGEYSEGTFKAGGSSETAVSPSSGFSSENNKLTYTFPAGTTSPQTVTFDTAIPDDMCYAEGWEQTVSNTARLLDSENNIKAQKPAVVTFTPTWIEKQGVPNYNNENGNSGIYDPKNRTITWTITANQYGAALPGAYITDPLPHDLTLVSATAQTWNGSDWVESPIQKWTEAPTD